jgi:sodium-dependent phosphate cotransporter
MARQPFIERIPTWGRVLFVFLTLYGFLVGIGAMSASFKMMGKDFSLELLGSGGGPLISLFVGILATTLVQSSSTTTSLVVTMVGTGVIPLDSAIFMVMGANIGTTVTNTIVSLGHVSHSDEYRRAFAAATVHDFFNIIVLIVLFPLEVYTGWLLKVSTMASDSFQGIGGMKLANPVKAATKPTITFLQDTVSSLGGGGGWLLALAVLMTFAALILLVKLLKSIMMAKLENLFDRVIFKSPVRGLIFGILLTILVQSSSITTSVAVPLVGAGVLSLAQVFPYTMGANIGTTVTGLLAALGVYAGAAIGDEATAALGLNLAFFHVLFNILGVALVWWFRWLPMKMADSFARLAIWNRLVPLVYIVTVFYLLPFLVVWFGRS